MRFGGIQTFQGRDNVRDDHEELLARNPVLLSRCFWHLARKYGDTAGGKAPGLTIFIVSAGLLFHKDTVDKVHRMNFDSRILKVVVERPDLLGGLQSRMEGAFSASLIALQLAVAAELLQRDGGSGFPTFRALGGTDLPGALRDP